MAKETAFPQVEEVSYPLPNIGAARPLRYTPSIPQRAYPAGLLEVGLPCRVVVRCEQSKGQVITDKDYLN